MQIWEIMSGPVATAPAAAPVAQGLVALGRWAIRHVVLLEGDDVAGVLCACDFERVAPWPARLEDLCTRPPVLIGPDLTVVEAAVLMRDQCVGCLPVCDGRELVGMVTWGDVRRVLDQVDGRDDVACVYCHCREGLGEDPRLPGFCACATCREAEAPPDDDDEIGVGG